jgi:hypothetical protein
MRQFWSLISIACIFIHVAARADSPDDALVESGLRLRRDHRDVDALEQFRRAYELRPSPRTRAQIGFAEQALGSWIEAESDLMAALGVEDDPWIASHKKTLEGELSAIRQHLGWAVVEANVQGAELWLQGARRDALPVPPMRLGSGPIEIEVRAPGHESVRRTVEIPAGGTVTAFFEFTSSPAPADRAAPAAAPPTEPPRPPEPGGPSARRFLAWGTLGAAGALLGGGIAAQVAREINRSRYNDDALCLYGDLSRDQRCGAYRGRAETAQMLADIAYVSAGAVAAASVVLFLASPPRSRSGGIHLWVDARSTSVQLGCFGHL